MSFFTILETILIGPLKLVFEIIFSIANRVTGNPGLSIVALSLIMNILVLPLYKRADAMQEQARDIDAKLRDGVAHIKKSFSGDERMMVLQTYYRQNHYKPTDALNGSVSLLLEIPFFMAAYQFLSHLEILNGVSFGPIVNLGAPDGLLVIGGVAINLLPILMTLINVISSALYLKGFPLKTKIQLYGMAAFFLVFLYTSPACLVFYWTLNNVFSLVKTIFYKLKDPKKVLRILASVLGVALIVLGLVYNFGTLKRKVFVIGVGCLLLLPWLATLVHIPIKAIEAKPDRKLFFFGTLFLTVLIGLLIPSTYIAASPQEFVDITYYHDPLLYLVQTMSLSVGTFLVWFGVFYWLASPKGKVVFDRLIWALGGVMLVNYLFFGTDLGVISSSLQYERGVAFGMGEQLLNLAVIFLVALGLYLLAAKKKQLAVTAVMTMCLVSGIMGVVNVNTIKGSLEELSQYDKAQDGMPHFELSKDGNNVIVIMLDRAMGAYVPYLMQEKPELKEQFDGFTYYENTISFGGCTNFGVPAMLGGYEYTPVEMNRRKEESLVSKHNEALKVMPVIFEENGYDVTVCDPPYANYQWIPDLSIYEEYPDIQAYITKGRFGDVAQKQRVIDNNYRNFFCFSVMKTMPLVAQPTIYNAGAYNQAADPQSMLNTVQTQHTMSSATGISSLFMESYRVLENLPYMTQISKDNEKNTFLFLANDVTHEPMLLQAPDYVPAETIDNTQYDAEHKDRFVVDGKTLKVEDGLQMIHYQSNMAAFLKLGEWFDYMREQGVYDNTRIILVSDHAWNIGHIPEMDLGSEPRSMKDTSLYYPLLMVKDFASEGFDTSNKFMTNADAPVLAVQDIIENPCNPFTGKALNSDEKTAHDQFVIMSNDWEVSVNNGNTFSAAPWASVKDNVKDPAKWTFFDEIMVLDEHVAP